MSDSLPMKAAAAIDHRGILRGRDILCFSHDWTGDPLSKTHLMRLLSRDNRVLWVNSIGYRTPTVSKADLGRIRRKLTAAMEPVREVEPNLFVLSPLAVPLYKHTWARRLNRSLLKYQVQAAMRRLRMTRPINWVFNPAAAVIAGQLGEDLLIYHCVDEYTEFTGVDPVAIGQLEQQLMERADLVLVSAERLYRSKSPHHPRTEIVRHGVDFEHFSRALDADLEVPAEIASLPRPVIGFFGLVADWVDVDVMAEMAKRFSHGSLVIVGKATTDVSFLQSLPNVHLLGRKPYQELPAYCKGWDVALMPFRINELTLCANPLKVREYLAAGLPVISTPLPEVAVLDQCYLASDADQFEARINEALQDPGPTRQRSDAIEHESWAARLNEIQNHLTSAVSSDRPALPKSA